MAARSRRGGGSRKADLGRHDVRPCVAAFEQGMSARWNCPKTAAERAHWRRACGRRHCEGHGPELRCVWEKAVDVRRRPPWAGRDSTEPAPQALSDTPPLGERSSWAQLPKQSGAKLVGRRVACFPFLRDASQRGTLASSPAEPLTETRAVSTRSTERLLRLRGGTTVDAGTETRDRQHRAATRTA